MMDFREFLRKENRVVDSEKDQIDTQRVHPVRHQLLLKARGSLRQHLEQQMLEAIRRFGEEPTSAERRTVA